MTSVSSAATASAASDFTTPRSRVFTAIALGGLTAGIFDISDAIVLTLLNNGSPIRMLQGIASGLLGRDAYQGGLPVAALGLAIHFFIATSATTTFVLVSRRLPVLVRRPVVCGLLFGLAVWGFMYQIVLPITFHRPYTMPAWPLLANQLGIHMLGVGLPIALVVSRVTRRAH